ncbi:uncharacterized protein LOC144656341 [Oculina patagonica]
MDHSDVLNRDLSQWENVVYGLAAVLAVISNLVLCVIIIKAKNASFDKSDISLLFNIAIAGLLTGIFTAITPPLIAPETTLTGLAASVYCRLLASWFLTDVLVKVSVITCMFIAIDQWFAIYRPEQHQNTFGRKQVKIFIWSTWIFSAVTAMVSIFSFENSGEKCVTTPLFGMGPETQQMVVLVQTFVTIFLPCLLTWLAIGSCLYQRKNLQVQDNQNISVKRLVMYSSVTLMITFSWFFEEITALASNSNVRHYARMLALCTPCLVPCICFAMSEGLRQQVKEDENSTTNNPREDCENGNTAHGNAVVEQEVENEPKNSMEKQYSVEQENALNQEKDRCQESLATENDFERIDLDDEKKNQPRAHPQLSVRRESFDDIMEAQRSPSAVHYVKRGEMPKIAMIW